MLVVALWFMLGMTVGTILTTVVFAEILKATEHDLQAEQYKVGLLSDLLKKEWERPPVATVEPEADDWWKRGEQPPWETV